MRTIAAAQSIPLRGAVEANVEAHVQLARVAAQEEAQVLVFPELSLTGYELDLAGDLAFSERDPRLAPLIAAAADCRMTLVAGAPVRIGARLHIGAFIVTPERTLELYTKHHLGAFPQDANPGGSVPPPEASVFRPGMRNPIVRIRDQSAAVAVCADTGQPSHPAAAAKRGARTYLASMFVIPRELEDEAARLGSYAARHSMCVAMANYGGPSGGLAGGGGSALWSDRGELLAQLAGSGAGIAVASEEAAGWRARVVMLE